MEQVIEFFAGNSDFLTQIVTLLVAGAFLPAAVTLVVRVLALPGIRTAVGGVCFAAGRTVSMTLTRWLGRSGRKLEDAMQDFIDHCKRRFFEGLDKDDKGSGDAARGS